MLDTELNFDKLEHIDMQIHSYSIRFPWWDPDEVAVSIILDKQAYELTKTTHYTLSTYEESKKMGKFMLYINRWPDEMSAWTTEQLYRAYIYVRRSSKLLQDYDPYNYETPSPQDISKNMDNIVGMIQDKVSELEDQSHQIENLVTITLTRDNIALTKDEEGQIILTDAYTQWAIADQTGAIVTDSFTCSAEYDTQQMTVEVNNTTHTATITSWPGSTTEISEFIKLKFVKEDFETVFYKYVLVTLIESGEDGKAYILSVESTNGDVFKPGEEMETTLQAHIFYNGIEITNYDTWHFYWTQTSYYQTEERKQKDKEFAIEHHGAGLTSVKITPDTVDSRATYSCYADYIG